MSACWISEIIIRNTFFELAHEEHPKYHKMPEDMAEDEPAAASDEQVAFVTGFLQNLLGRLEGFEENIKFFDR